LLRTSAQTGADDSRLVLEGRDGWLFLRNDTDPKAVSARLGAHED
jgi:hypothetical protein